MLKIVKETSAGEQTARKYLTTMIQAKVQLERYKNDHTKLGERVSYHGDHIVCANSAGTTTAVYSIRRE